MPPVLVPTGCISARLCIMCLPVPACVPLLAEYVDMLPLLGVSDTAAGASTGNTLPFMVGRVSYTFGFQASPAGDTPAWHITRPHRAQPHLAGSAGLPSHAAFAPRSMNRPLPWLLRNPHSAGPVRQHRHCLLLLPGGRAPGGGGAGAQRVRYGAGGGRQRAAVEQDQREDRGVAGGGVWSRRRLRAGGWGGFVHL